MIKQKRGYSLGVLVITISIMIILTTTVLLSVRSMSDDRAITDFMNDITEVSEYVKEYYSEKRVLPLKYDENQNPIGITGEEYDNIIKQTGENNKGNYYHIDLNKLERINLKDKNRGYVVNDASLKIYVVKPINYQGLEYYTITDEMTGHDKTYNNSGDFEVVISGNPITWASKAKLTLSVPSLSLNTSDDDYIGDGWTFKYYIGGPIKADEFKNKGRLFLYGETVEITENGVISFYVENSEGYAKVVNVIVTMIDEIKPSIILNGDREEDGELIITDDETGINPEKLLYKIIGYDDDLQTMQGGREILLYGMQYIKYIEKYNELDSELKDVQNQIMNLTSQGSGDEELSNIYSQRDSVKSKIDELNNQNRDFNNGSTPYSDSEPNIAVYIEDYAGNKNSYLYGVSRKVLLNSNLIDYETKPLENSNFGIVKTSQYTNANTIGLRIRSQGATHMLITLDSSISPNDLTKYEPYASSNGENEIDIENIESGKVTVYAYFTAGEYENGSLIYNAFSDSIIVDREEPTNEAPRIIVSNDLELDIDVLQKDIGSGISKVEYGYLLATEDENIVPYTWKKSVAEIEQILEYGKSYYIKTKATDKAGNPETISKSTLLTCPERKIVAEPNAPKIGSMQAITWNNNLDEIEINSVTKKDSAGNSWIWYDYALGNGIDDNGISKWANAKTTDGNYFVWIPRYAYKIIYYTDASKTEVKGYYKKSPYTGTIGYFLADGETVSTESSVKTLYGSIDIVFLYNAEDDRYLDAETNQLVSLIEGGTKLHSEYIVHPAFKTSEVGENALGTWGNSSLTGIWVSKFEASRSDANYLSQGTSEVVKSVPDVRSLTNITIGKAYSYATSFDSSMNSHLMKSSEWGAVAYLAYSAYGRNGHAIQQNLCSDIITGAGTTDDGSDYATVNEAKFKSDYGYKTGAGFESSTTKNIYGIYDMAGGAAEFVASYINNGMLTSTNIGSLQSATTAYAQIYAKGTSDSSAGNYSKNSNIYGDAIYELSTNGTQTWENNSINYPYGNEAIFVRGGSYSNETGMFEVERSTGAGDEKTGFRIILAQ